MSMANLFSSRAVRVLALSIIVSVVIAFTPSFVTPTLSCPGPSPQPLRELYVRSASIVIARLGKTETTKVENNNGDNNENESGITPLKTTLLVSSTLKGDHQPVVYVNHYMFRDYKDQLSSAGDDEDLLVFLNHIPGMDGYYVDMNYGIKKLSDADLNSALTSSAVVGRFSSNTQSVKLAFSTGARTACPFSLPFSSG